jgi:hypothetical protein
LASILEPQTREQAQRAASMPFIGVDRPADHADREGIGDPLGQGLNLGGLAGGRPPTTWAESGMYSHVQSLTRPGRRLQDRADLR